MKFNKTFWGTLLVLNLICFNAQSVPVFWTDWVSEDSSSSATGQLDVNSLLIGINYSSTSNHAFMQTGTGTNFWSGSAYTNGNVDNAPTPAEQIALNGGGTVTINFDSAIQDVYIALNSWNGNVVEFSSPIVFDSFGAGFFGSGSPTLNGTSGFTGVGELHGVVQLLGSFTSISFTHTSENWHGFTIGVAGRADPIDVPEPTLLAVLGFAMLILARRQLKH